MSKITVGVVDSGIDLNSKLPIDCRSVRISKGKDNKLSKDKNIKDEIGHGTAIANIICKINKNVEICVVKIFTNKLSCELELLIEGIKYCIEKNIKYINLSLGVELNGNSELHEVCKIAKRKGIKVISVYKESNQGRILYPGAFIEVDGVISDPDISPDKIKIINNEKKRIYGAFGGKQRLQWNNDSEILLDGASFACARVTGYISSYENMEEEIIDIKELEYDKRDNGNLVKSKVEEPIDLNWIKDSVIFPFSKEMHSLIRFRDMLNFKVVKIVDFIAKGCIGKDSGEIIGIKNNGIIVEHDLNKAIKSVDTLILGHIEEISKIYRKDMLLEYLKLADKYNKNVVSLSMIDEEKYKEILQSIRKTRNIIWPSINEGKYYQILKDFSVINKPSSMPVLGIFGTGPKTGKFTLQILLKKMFNKIGVDVGLIGTEPQSILFGFDHVFPLGYEGYYNISGEKSSFILRCMVNTLEKNKDIILASGQSGIIRPFIDKSPVDIIKSISILSGICPDTSILCVKVNDSIDLIKENINVIQAVSKGVVVAIVTNSLSFGFENKDKIKYYKEEQLPISKLQKHNRDLELKIGVPCCEVQTFKGQSKLMNLLINRYEEK